MSLFFVPLSCVLSFFFFFNDTATTEIYTLSLHDALPISWRGQASLAAAAKQGYRGILSNGYYLDLGWPASRHYAVDPISGDAANLSPEDRKSTRLNSSHGYISYAVFCLKKKKK